MAKDPAILFYPADWLNDNVSGCSLEAQGLWLRMLILAHSSERRGYLQLNGKAMQESFIAAKCGSSVPQYLTLLQELDNAAVPSRTPEGTIYNRRMVRDERKRALDRDRQRKHRGVVTRDVTPSVTQRVTRVSPIEYDHEVLLASNPKQIPPNPPRRGARRKGPFQPGLKQPATECGWCGKPLPCESQECEAKDAEIRMRHAAHA